MRKFKQWLQCFTGPDIHHKKAPKYIAINLSYHYYIDAGRLNDYILFDSKKDFAEWLDKNVAKIDQDGWVLYAPLVQPQLTDKEKT